MQKDGPLLILAGPGSGKTKTLTHRIAYLISSGVKAQNILAVTFTNKAADEMRERVLHLLSVPNANSKIPYAQTAMPLVGTFHSVCVRILREHAPTVGYTKHFTIYDDTDQLALTKKIMKDYNISEKQVAPAKVRAVISRAKDELKTPDIFLAEAGNYFERQIAKIYTAYQEALAGNDAFDFDDLIMQTVLLLQTKKEVREKLQSRFKYVLVDEYQDTNTSQYTLVNILARESGNLCVVGDDAQAIYSWRNANFQNILDFERDWPNAHVVKLEQNYRSTSHIVEAASALIQNNTQGYHKKLWTQNESGEKIRAHELGNEHEEAAFILSEIEGLVRDNSYRLNDFVVLYRTNAQSRALEEIFIRAGTPYKIVGGVKFYQRAEIKDVIAWLRLIQNKDDAAAKERLLKLKLVYLKKNIESPVKRKEQAVAALASTLRNNVKDDLNLTSFLKFVIKTVNGEEIYRDGTDRGEDRWQNIQELLSVSEDYAELPLNEALEKFLEDVALAQEADNVSYNSDLVHFMTLHMAKGLEFPVVFIAGCEEGILPHLNSMLEPEQFEEERRLFYVGLTRAKHRAYLTFARHRMLWGSISANPPSSFLFEIPQKHIKFAAEEEDEEKIIEF